MSCEYKTTSYYTIEVERQTTLEAIKLCHRVLSDLGVYLSQKSRLVANVQIVKGGPEVPVQGENPNTR